MHFLFFYTTGNGTVASYGNIVGTYGIVVFDNEPLEASDTQLHW